MKVKSLIVLLLNIFIVNSLAGKSVTTNQFRDIFVNLLDDEVQQRNYEKLIYLPTKKMGETPKNSISSKAFMDSLNASYSSISAHELYKKGKMTPLNKPIISFDRAVKKKPLTIVIVPGVFGEFIATKAFQEIFRVDSSYRAEVKSMFDRDTTGSLYSKFLSVLKVKAKENKLALTDRRPITEFFTISNIGDNVKLLLFNTSRMSLESIGPFEARSDLFLDRLNMFFKLMGVPENIAFIGYSRGSVIALDMLSKSNKKAATDNDYLWIKNVRALVSIGGVNYGADSADPLECDDLKNANCKTIKLLGKLADDLEYFKGPGGALRPANIAVRYRNYKRFVKLLVEIKKNYSKEKKNKFSKIVSENEKKTPKGKRSILKLFRKIKESYKNALSFLRAGDSSAVMEMVFYIFFESIELDKFYSEYDRNISKFKIVLKETITAVKELSTKQRFAWWKTSTLPVKNVRYYSVAGTMADLEMETDGFILGENSVAYNKDTYDYKFLRATYNQYVKDSTFKLNDSQVAIHKARFWPKLNCLLSPYYKENEMKTTFLGVLGVHHWGLALEYANKMVDNAVSPFPRVSLFKALATTISLDIELGEEKSE